MDANLGRCRFQRALIGAVAIVFTAAAVPSLPAQTSAIGPSTAAPDGETPSFEINFSNKPIQDLLPLYQKVTGKKLILDDSFQGENLRIVGARPMTRTEAANFLGASLLLNGYAIVAVNAETVKLVRSGGDR